MNAKTYTRFLKVYNDSTKKAKVPKTRSSLLLELILSSWAAFSLRPQSPLPPRLQLGNWLAVEPNAALPGAFFAETLSEIDASLKMRQGAYSSIYQHFAQSPEAGQLLPALVDLYAELLLEAATYGDWEQLYREHRQAYLKSFYRGQMDPEDLAQLMVRLFVQLNENHPAAKIFIPQLRNGVLVDSLRASNAAHPTAPIIGWSEEPELFSISLIHFRLLGAVDTDGLELKPMDRMDELNKAELSTLFIFPVDRKSEERAYERLFPRVIQNKNVSVLVVPQSLLFARKHQKKRRYLMHYSFLRAVVTLPSSPTFFNRTKMVLLVFDPQRGGETLFVNADTPSRTTKRKVVLTEGQVEQIVSVVAASQEVPGFSKKARLLEVRGAFDAFNMSSILQPVASPPADWQVRTREMATIKEKLEEIEQQVTQGFEQLLNQLNLK